MNVRRRLGRALSFVVASVALLGAGILWSPAANAAVNATATVNSQGVPLNVRSGPTTGDSVIGSRADGSTVGLDCWSPGTAITGPYGTTTVWYQLDGGGWVTDAFLYTGTNDPVTPGCGGDSGRNWGNQNSGNYFPYGQCTWGAYEKFHEATGVWPMINGNAKDWHDSAIANGWSVVLDAEPRAVVVFQPGVAGAHGVYGHVAWVDSVTYAADGTYIHITEMNANGAGDGTWSTRTVLDQVGMSFILAP